MVGENVKQDKPFYDNHILNQIFLHISQSSTIEELYQRMTATTDISKSLILHLRQQNPHHFSKGFLPNFPMHIDHQIKRRVWWFRIAHLWNTEKKP